MFGPIDIRPKAPVAPPPPPPRCQRSVYLLGYYDDTNGVFTSVKAAARWYVANLPTSKRRGSGHFEGWDVYQYTVDSLEYDAGDWTADLQDEFRACVRKLLEDL